MDKSIQIHINNVIRIMRIYYDNTYINPVNINSLSVYQILYVPSSRKKYYTEKVLFINMCNTICGQNTMINFEYPYDIIYKYTYNMDQAEYDLHIYNIINCIKFIATIYRYQHMLPIITETLIYRSFVKSNYIIDPILKSIVIFSVSIEFI